MRSPKWRSPLPDQEALCQRSERSITSVVSVLSVCVLTHSPACSEEVAGAAAHPQHVCVGSQRPTSTNVFFFCLFYLPTRSPASHSLWEAMLTSKQKEAVMEVRRQLVEAASKEKLPIKMSMGKKPEAIQKKKHAFCF